MVTKAEKAVKQSRLSLQAVLSNGRAKINPGTAIGTAEPDLKLNKPGMDLIESGSRVLFTVVVFEYADQSSASEHALYYNERCTYYDANMRTFIDCPGSLANFKGRQWPWGE